MTYSKKLEQSIDAVFDAEGLEKKKMFGGVGYKVKGNMCFGILGDDAILRLGEERANELIDSGIAKPFASAGRKPMRGWATVDWQTVSPKELEKLLNESYDYALTLPE
jgi:TfoX/Sxy family transcriptional regulator of competence genes